ncbi:Ger(x)C family spore germination protein [Brevibacillus choshinensis]|uniref:Ger(x)C family spore germination protein n=1 Tax=Brevibacillus choshinensis TaxID=54911 RepID=UPI002E23880A|nr:Ger(x)C family spore germination protein [Brevibacillus choshinensis]MED4779941.1 Ger(x)C family spore germination protein [Brevibacillus choshinensis]
MIICLTLSLLFFAGGIEKRVLERMGLIVAVGYDELPRDRLLGTAVLYQIDPDAKEKVNVISNTAFTSKGFRNAANVESSKKLAGGQIRVAVYHEPLARKGIINLVDTLSRDADIGTGVYLTVSKTRVVDLLSHRYPEFANIGAYLYQNIKQNIRGERLISSTLHEFLHDYYSVGKDPVLPYITLHGDEVMINKIAMFKDDRMVGTMSLQDAFLIKLLRDRFRAGNIELKIDAKPLAKYLHKGQQDKPIHIVLEQIGSKSRINVMDPTTPTFDIQVKFEVSLQEIDSQIDLGKPDSLKALQKEVNTELVHLLQTFLKETQKMGVDPIGFGLKYNAQVRGAKLTKEKWRSYYQKAKFNINFNTMIIRTGVSR